METRSLLSVAATSYLGLDSSQNDPVVEPPDPIIAAGPNTVVEMVNTRIAIYNKSGVLESQESLSSLFPTDAGLSFSDPQATYDTIHHRFFVGAVAYDLNGGISRFDYAVSNGPDATDGFSTYSIDTSEGGNYLGDFPRVGWNNDAYFVTFNMFTFSGSFSHVQLVTIKSSDLSVANRVPLGNAFTVVPAVTPDAAAGGPEWFVEEASFQNGHTLSVVLMTNVLDPNASIGNGNFSLSYVSVPSYSPPPQASQPHGPAIDTGDTRILSVFQRGDHLYATQNVGTNRDAHARWYDISIGGASLPSLYESGEINPGRGIDTYYPAIAVSPNGTIGLTYMQSSSRQYMSMYVTGRTASDDLGKMQTPVLIQPGRGTYYGSRAGDFSGVSVDVDTLGNELDSFWAASEYATSPLWGTGIARFSISPSTGTGPGHPHGQGLVLNFVMAVPITNLNSSSIEIGLVLPSVHKDRKGLFD